MGLPTQRHARLLPAGFYRIVQRQVPRRVFEYRQPNDNGHAESVDGSGGSQCQRPEPENYFQSYDPRDHALEGRTWAHKLQELELDLNLQLDLKKNQDLEATGKDINECLVVLRAAAGRLAPDAETRVTLRKQEVAVRDHAIRAEVHLDPEIRKTASYFQQKTTELHALNRSFEEIRTRLVTQIDRLAELKIQLGIVTAAQIGEAVKGGEVSLDDIQGITEHARRIAADLDGFGRASAVTTEPAEAVKPVEVAKPAEVKVRNGREPAFAEKKRSGRLGLFDRPGRRGAALRHCRYNRTSRRAY